MEDTALRVGELARRTGLTVRTLHHYDELGLLRPSRRSEAGYRLYGAAEVGRLQQILSLRGLGFSLEEVGRCLAAGGLLPVEVLRLHLDRLQNQIDRQQRLCERLAALAGRYAAAEAVPMADLLRTIREMTMVESYYTPEQLEQLARRREEVGEERMQSVGQDWADLYADFAAAMDRGEDPAGPAAQALARRHEALIAEFTGGDPGIRDSLNRLWQEQGDALRAQHQMPAQDPALADYVGRVLAAAG